MDARHKVFLIMAPLLMLLCYPNAVAQDVLGEHLDQKNLPKLAPPVSMLGLPGPLAAAPPYRVRIVYMVPSNRDAQPQAEQILQRYVLSVQSLYRENMARQGYGNKTFEFETEADGLIPKVHIVRVSQPDTSFHDSDYGTRWGKILNGVASAGFPAFVEGEVLWVVAEIHQQLADGSFLESSLFFGGAGIQNTGAAVVTGETLALMPSTFLVDDREYNGLVIPTMGPFPLVSNVSFASFTGSTVSSITSSNLGGAAHELGHGFALPHDFTNDDNFNGNLMGNGLRGFRGFFYPEKYPSDDVGLSGASALHLNSNRFFNAGTVFTSQLGPSVGAPLSATIAGGLFRVALRAFDADSLTGAVLLRNGNAVAHMRLTGNSVDTAISTYDYQPGVSDQWELAVYNSQANRTVVSAVLTPPIGANRAPVPFIRLSKTHLQVGEQITLDALRSFDPDGSSSQLQVLWDLNGDGIFDTPPSMEKTLNTSFSAPGVYQVFAKLTDAQGNSSLSSPVGVRVEPPVVNSLVSFGAISSTFSSNAAGCPSEYAGKFFINTKLTNESARSLSNLRVEIAKLTGGHLVLGQDELLQEGQFFDVLVLVPGNQLLPGIAQNVPFTLCLEKRQPFELFVNVHGTEN